MHTNARRRLFTMWFLGVLVAALSIATIGIPKSYSQNTDSYCVDFRQDYGSVIDCFVSDKLCQEFENDLSHDVKILTSCNESEE